jgi:hypothetical protein
MKIKDIIIKIETDSEEQIELRRTEEVWHVIGIDGRERGLTKEELEIATFVEAQINEF